MYLTINPSNLVTGFGLLPWSITDNHEYRSSNWSPNMAGSELRQSIHFVASVFHYLELKFSLELKIFWPKYIGYLETEIGRICLISKNIFPMATLVLAVHLSLILRSLSMPNPSNFGNEQSQMWLPTAFTFASTGKFLGVGLHWKIMDRAFQIFLLFNLMCCQ